MDKAGNGHPARLPLSPYLFLIIMHVMFHDVHKDPSLEEKLKQNKIIGAMFYEILYADATICIAQTAAATARPGAAGGARA